jgi:hypothetical protein
MSEAFAAESSCIALVWDMACSCFLRIDAGKAISSSGRFTGPSELVTSTAPDVLSLSSSFQQVTLCRFEYFVFEGSKFTARSRVAAAVCCRLFESSFLHRWCRLIVQIHVLVTASTEDHLPVSGRALSGARKEECFFINT